MLTVRAVTVVVMHVRVSLVGRVIRSRWNRHSVPPFLFHKTLVPPSDIGQLEKRLGRLPIEVSLNLDRLRLFPDPGALLLEGLSRIEIVGLLPALVPMLLAAVWAGPALAGRRFLRWLAVVPFLFHDPTLGEASTWGETPECRCFLCRNSLLCAAKGSSAKPRFIPQLGDAKIGLTG